MRPRIKLRGTTTVELLHYFDQAVAAVGGEAAVRKALQSEPGGDRVWLLAIGKAASGMTLGAQEVLGQRLQQGLVITKYQHGDAQLSADSRLQCIESAHPVPDQASLDAGRLLVEFLQRVPAEDELLVLISGGASSLVELLPPEMQLSDLSRMTEHMLSNGLDIIEMNIIRKSVSCIKGGRLAAWLGQYAVRQLLISDVPGDNLEDIGSGLLVESQRTLDPESDLARSLPDWLNQFQSATPALSSTGIENLRRLDSRIVASNAIACQAAAEAVAQAGETVVQAQGSLNGDVEDISAQIISVLTSASACNGVYIWGGESTLNLPAQPGRGGRNQHLALKVAQGISDHPGITVLSCGTDGSDGPTADAGGMVNSDTVSKGLTLGLDVNDFLARADAGNYLQATDALVTTGPTGTNVMDLVIARKHA